MSPSPVGGPASLGGTASLTPLAGAGVAGLALAMGLHRKGISFTLYEEAPEYSVVGFGSPPACLVDSPC